MRSFAGTRSFFGLVALAALLAAPAGSIVYVMQSDEDMLRHAQLIVWGEVTGTASARLDGRLVTDAQVRVETVLKGRLAGSVVTVRQPGGVEGGRSEFLAGLPMLSEGNRVLLFLEKHEDVYRTVGLGLGVFFEASHLGRKILVRDAPHLASGQVAEEGSVRDSSRFRRWLEDRAAGRESRADYLAADPADGPRSVASPYVLFGQSSGHKCEGEEYYDPNSGWTRDEFWVVPRWRRFDAGGTVSFHVRGLQESLSAEDASEATRIADAMSGIRAAMAAWTKANSAVRLAAIWDGATLPKWGEARYRRLATIELSAPTLPTDHPFIVAGAILSKTCNYSLGEGFSHIARPDSVHTIPGTDVKAAVVDGARIYTHPLLAVHLAKLEDGAANDFVEVITHELGHTLGLHHSNEAGSIMRSRATIDGVNPGLGTDDVNGIKFLYPVVAPPPSFGGGAPAPEPEPEPEPEPPPPPPPVPPVASFTVDMSCADGLCGARTGEDVTFTDTSSGTVARRSWDFETGGRTPSGKSVTHAWPSPGFYRSTLTVEGAGAESTSTRMFRVDPASPAGSCVPGPETVCLQDSRYEVEVEWHGGDGALNAGRVVHAGTNDSGLFSFFDRDNWEMLVKVLNGCSINGHHWVYAASATDLGYVIRVTDTATGELREFRNEAGQVASAVVDNEAFSNDCAAPASRAGWSALAGGETLSLGDGRFEVGIEWSTDADAGVARTVRRGTEDSGLFWFFDPGNWEVLVKVLDGCGVNGHHWVYAASATSLPFEMSVTDTETGEVYRYVKGADELAALADPAAFVDSCEAAR
ncbi:MAG: matrixin family metalloprotease [Holophagales bacterium]|nr:matrixin family metalloprotease [Holophagales bacterium]